MLMNIAIKDISDHLANRLKERAAHNSRTPEDEARAILEQALGPETTVNGPTAVLEELRRLGVQTTSNSVEIIRADRDR